MMKRVGLFFLVFLLQAGRASADPLPASQRLQLANGLFSRGMNDLAETEYKAVLPDISDAEQRTQVLFRLGECARTGGRNPEALAWYTEAMNKGQGDFALHARLRQGQLLLDAGKAADAVDILLPLTRVDSAEHAAAGLYYRARALKAARDAAYPEEVRQLIQRFSQSPYAGYAALELAEWLDNAKAGEADIQALLEQAASSKAGDAVVARSLYLQGERAFMTMEYAASARLFDELLRQFPDREEARLGRLRAAWSYLYLKNFRKVLPLIQETDAATRSKDEAGWLYLEANAYRNLGNAVKASALYEQMEREQAASTYAPAAAYEFSLLEMDAVKQQSAEEQQEVTQRVLARSSLLMRHGALHPEALWLLVQATEQAGRVDEAAALLAGLIEKDPDPARQALASYKLGELYQRQQQAEEALTQFKKTAAAYPDSPEAPVSLMAAAQVASAQGDSAAAIFLWDQVAGSYPGHAMADDALYQSGLASMRGNQRKAAEAAFAKLLKTESPFRAEALFWWGVMLEGAEDDAGAMGRYQQALELKPEASLQARMHYRLGILQQQSGKVDEAVAHLLAAIDGEVLSLLQADPAALGWLTKVCEEKQHSEQALRAASAWAATARTAEDLQQAHVAKGDALVHLKREQEALISYQEALASAAATRAGARAACWMGNQELKRPDRADQAAAYFEQAGSMASSLGVLDLQAASYMGLGRVAEQRKDFAEAARYFMGVAVLFDDATMSSEALYRAAEAFQMEGQPDKADKAINELQARYPESTWGLQPTEE